MAVPKNVTRSRTPQLALLATTARTGSGNTLLSDLSTVVLLRMDGPIYHVYRIINGWIYSQPVADTAGCVIVKPLPARPSIHPANVFLSKFCHALLHAESSIFPVDPGSQPAVHVVIIQRVKYEVKTLNMRPKKSILALCCAEWRGQTPSIAHTRGSFARSI